MKQQSDIFTIEESVNFHPKENLLKNTKNGKSALLNWPTSCCLLLLIKHHGETVTTTTFMQQVWGSKNIIISKNTLIKNISLLRSAVAYIGLPKTLVSTINGEGYTIPLSYQITHTTLVETRVKDNELKMGNDIILAKKSYFTPIFHLIKYSWTLFFLVYILIFINT